MSFESLNLDSKKTYKLKILAQCSNARLESIDAIFNDNTTLTDYEYQTIIMSAQFDVTSSKGDEPEFMRVIGENFEGPIRLNIDVLPSGKITVSSDGFQNDNTENSIQIGSVSSKSAVSLTKLTIKFRSASSKFLEGSIFELREEI